MRMEFKKWLNADGKAFEKRCSGRLIAAADLHDNRLTKVHISTETLEKLGRLRIYDIRYMYVL